MLIRFDHYFANPILALDNLEPDLTTTLQKPRFLSLVSKMHPTILLATLAAVIPAIHAEELRFDDVPTACKTICQPIVDLTNACDVDPEGMDMDKAKRSKIHLRQAEESDEAIETNCICTNKSFDVAGVMGLCTSCLTQNRNTEDGILGKETHERFGR